MADPLPDQFLKNVSMSPRKCIIDIEEPTSVLELVYNSPSSQCDVLQQIWWSDDEEAHVEFSFPGCIEQETLVPSLFVSECPLNIDDSSLRQGLHNFLDHESRHVVDMEAAVQSTRSSEDVLVGADSVLAAFSSALEDLPFPEDFWRGDDGNPLDCLGSMAGSSMEELPMLNSNNEWSLFLNLKQTSQGARDETVFPGNLDTPNGMNSCNINPQFREKVDPVPMALGAHLPTSGRHRKKRMKINYKTENDGRKHLYFTQAKKQDLHSSTGMGVCEDSTINNDFHLLQKLLACAKAVSCHDTRQAELLLHQIQSMVSPYGNSMQRVTMCFVEGTRSRLRYLMPILHSDIAAASCSTIQQPSEKQKQESFDLMCEACPFLPFGYFAANSIILDAVQGQDLIHIIDLGIDQSGLQWPALLQSLACRPEGRPRLLRITAVGTSSDKMNSVRSNIQSVAMSLKIQFQFKQLLQPLENLHKHMLDVREDESVVVNSVLKLHCLVKESRGALNSLLQTIHEIHPKVMTLIEPDANHNGPFFLARFVEALHYYSAIFESLEATMPPCSTKRMKIEQFHFGEEIRNILSCEGSARVERHERMDQWRRRMGRAGFQPFPLGLLSLHARIWLARYDSSDEYTLMEEKGGLILGWKGKPILGASAWTC